MSYTPSVANPLLISYEAHTNRQKHQTLGFPHFYRHARHRESVLSAAPVPLYSSTSRLYNLSKFPSVCCLALHATDGFFGARCVWTVLEIVGTVCLNNPQSPRVNLRTLIPSLLSILTLTYYTKCLLCKCSDSLRHGLSQKEDEGVA